MAAPDYAALGLTTDQEDILYAVREFVDNMSSGKRPDLVDKLLARKEFSDLWVMKFAELLLVEPQRVE